MRSRIGRVRRALRVPRAAQLGRREDVERARAEAQLARGAVELVAEAFDVVRRVDEQERVAR